MYKVWIERTAQGWLAHIATADDLPKYSGTFKPTASAAAKEAEAELLKILQRDLAAPAKPEPKK